MQMSNLIALVSFCSNAFASDGNRITPMGTGRSGYIASKQSIPGEWSMRVSRPGTVVHSSSCFDECTSPGFEVGTEVTVEIFHPDSALACSRRMTIQSDRNDVPPCDLFPEEPLLATNLPVIQATSFETTNEKETYKYNTPAPQSQLEGDSNACSTVDNYLYDPANCDEGYWCGCTSADPDMCIPSNNTNITVWVGHFTTVDEATGEQVVLVGHAGNDSLKCLDTLYCPGLKNTEVCPSLCAAGKYCPDASKVLDCPKGSYCPRGSVEPTPCRGLMNCGSTNLDIHRAYPATICVIAVAIVLYGLLLLAKSRVIKQARRSRKREVSPEVQTDRPKLRNSRSDLTGSEVRMDDGLRTIGREISAISEEGSAEKEEDNPESNAANVGDGIGLQTSVFKDDLAIPDPESPGLPIHLGLRAFRSASVILGPTRKTLDIRFENLRLTLPNGGPTIMRGVSGNLNHGTLTAVMGPSGAGKSTFLSILAGKVDRTGGTLSVNGIEAELPKFRRIIGFVPQEDIMLRELSVEEIVRHSALMRLPQEWPAEKKLDRVDKTLTALDLDRVRDSIIGDEIVRGISGGQRKRVNIAMEMVTDPSLLCLDEPTSGLDSTSSFSVLQALKGLAECGVNVAAVIHQPKYEIFELFDKVLLLGVGGRTVYLGPATGMAKYFADRGFPLPPNANPADYYMDVVAGIIPCTKDPEFDKDNLFEMWESAPENPDAVTAEEAARHRASAVAEDEAEQRSRQLQLGVGPLRHFAKNKAAYLRELQQHFSRNFGPEMDKNRKIPGAFSQSWLLFKRAVLQRVRRPKNTLFPLAMEAFAGVVVGLSSRNQTQYTGIPEAFLNQGKGGTVYVDSNVRTVDLIPSIWSTTSLAVLLVSVLGVDVYGHERANFFREAATGLRVSAYWAAKTADVFIWIPLYSAVFIALSYGISPYLQTMSSYWLVVYASHIGYYGVGMLASLTVSVQNRGIFTLVCGLVLNLCFTGITFVYGDSSVQGLFRLFYTFWTAQTFSTSEYNKYSPPYDIELLNDVNSPYGDGVGVGYDITNSFSKNIGFAFLTALAWHVVVLLVLKMKDIKKQR